MNTWALTDEQFVKFEQLAELMDSSNITPRDAAKRALNHGIPERFVVTLTGLSLITIRSLIK